MTAAPSLITLYGGPRDGEELADNQKCGPLGVLQMEGGAYVLDERASSQLGKRVLMWTGLKLNQPLKPASHGNQ